MEKKMMIMAITAAIAILASSGVVTYAASADDFRPGVEGLGNKGLQVCKSEPQAAQSQEWMESWYSYSPPTGERGLMDEHRYGINLTQPEKGMDYLDQPGGQPAGVQGLWPNKPDEKCG